MSARRDTRRRWRGAHATWLRCAAATTLAACVTITASACATVIDGQPVSLMYDPFTVAGLPAADGPSGPRDGAPKPEGQVQGTDGGAMDALAVTAVNDLEQFWQQNYTGFTGTFRPVDSMLSYDSRDPNSPEVCGGPTYQNPNAEFCPPEWMMAWDRGAMLPVGQRFFGPMSVVALVAHEYGHAIQNMAKLINEETPVLVKEQQADCFSGVYMRWVAEGKSPRFALSTGDGLNLVLAAAIAIRDPIITPDDTELLEQGHGTALDRISAFQMGFTDGAQACVGIDMGEIEARRGDLPMSLQEDPTGQMQTGEAPITEQTLKTLMAVLGQIFSPAKPPTLSLSAAACPDAQPTGPAAYCPATNTITVDMPALKSMGKPADESDYELIQGDDTALSVVTSRYMLALEHERGQPLDSATAALRTACLTGVAQRRMAEPIKSPSGDELVLTAGDLDKAVAGLLTNGKVASEVNGATVPAGFTRIVAFRSGLLGDEDLCNKRFG
jgi:predicted metalloprotease